MTTTPTAENGPAITSGTNNSGPGANNVTAVTEAAAGTTPANGNTPGNNGLANMNDDKLQGVPGSAHQNPCNTGMSSSDENDLMGIAVKADYQKAKAHCAISVRATISKLEATKI